MTNKFIAGAASLALALAVLLTGCSAPVQTVSGNDSDVVAPEEVSEMVGTGEVPVSAAVTPEPVSAADVSMTSGTEAVSGTSGAEDSAGVSIESNSSMISSSTDEDSVIYAILPSDAGSCATEAAIIRAGVEGKGYTVAVRTHGNSMEKQTEAFDEAIETDAAAIICDNVEGDETTASIQKAKDAGIPTFLINTGIEVAGVAEAQILTDRFSNVPVLAQVFAKNRNHKTAYIELAGASDDVRATDAMAAFEDAMAAFPDVTLAESATEDEYDSEGARTKIAALLQNNPGAAVLICYNELETLSGLEAIKAAGRDDMQVYCVCGDGDMIETLISSGQVAASIVKPAETLAKTAADELMDYLSTGSFGTNERQYVSADIMTAGGIAR